jgi:hypothetical protein
MQLSLQPSARFALVAGARGVVEIGASRALQEIAADGRRVAKLRRGSGEQRLGDYGKAEGKVAVMRQIGIAHERSDPDIAARQMFDPAEPRQAIEVDETARAGDAALHQVKKVGAGGQIGGARLRGGRDGLGDRRGPEIIECVHATCFRSSSLRRFCASSTASVMPI